MPVAEPVGHLAQGFGVGGLDAGREQRHVSHILHLV